MLNFRLDQLLLIKNLQCNNELGLLFACEVDLAELASSEWLSKFEVINTPLGSFSWILSNSSILGLVETICSL